MKTILQRSLAVLLILFAARASAQKTSVILAQTASDWPGVSFQVSKVQRVDSKCLIVFVRIVADNTAQNPTEIGTVHVDVMKNPPVPFSLAKCMMVDEATGAKYPALPEVPDKPYFGMNSIITKMKPGEWFQMCTAFPIPPPPPPDSNGKIPEQKVSIFFPKAKLPAKDIVIPPPPAES